MMCDFCSSFRNWQEMIAGDEEPVERRTGRAEFPVCSLANAEDRKSAGFYQGLPRDRRGRKPSPIGLIPHYHLYLQPVNYDLC